MHEPTSFPPPPSPRPPAEPEPNADDAGDLRPGWAVFTIAAGLATALAIGIGLTVGFVVDAASASDCSPSDGWCALGAAIFGLLAGAITGAIAYVVAGVLTVRRLRPTGHRAGPIAAHLAAPPVLILTLQTIAMLLDVLT